jgi:hypothetical protein
MTKCTAFAVSFALTAMLLSVAPAQAGTVKDPDGKWVVTLPDEMTVIGSPTGLPVWEFRRVEQPFNVDLIFNEGYSLPAQDTIHATIRDAKRRQVWYANLSAGSNQFGNLKEWRRSVYWDNTFGLAEFVSPFYFEMTVGQRTVYQEIQVNWKPWFMLNPPTPTPTPTRTTVVAAPAKASVKYKNCEALWKDHPGGVMKSKSVKDKQGKAKTKGTVAAKVYAANKRLDRDRDGWACEK